MSARIRLATFADAAQVLEIYAPHVSNSTVSFELEPPSLPAMTERIAKVTASLPWLVLEEEGAVLGYAYATPFNERAAYAWSVDVAVYVREAARRRGVAEALYTSLLAVLRLAGFRNAVAIIALPNDPSVALHESLGFRPVGLYPRIGYKRGAWRDVGHWLLSFGPTEGPPPEPPDFRRWVGSQEMDAALASGLGRFRTGTP
jgi:L-amino acid N-acyltransferase YncA